MEQLLGSDNFNIVPHALALVIAYALAFPLGWNREQEERSAGLRTFPARRGRLLRHGAGLRRH